MNENNRPPCEIMVNKVLPHLRRGISKILSERYGMRQNDIAEIMGITQASVSQYLNATRGQDNLLDDVIPEIESYAVESAEEIVERLVQNGDKYSSKAILCQKCKKIRDNNNFREYIEELRRLKGLRIYNCLVCR